jgi:two-component system LytT family response regulator
MNPLKCIIVDDEPEAILILRRYIEQLSYLTLIKTFRNSSEALEYLSAGMIDIVFLDINMPNLSGLQIAKLIDKRTKIIFTTAYPQYAVDGFELNAADYLLKPVTFERLIMAVNKVRDQKLSLPDAISENDKWIVLKSGAQLNRMSISDILFLEKVGNYIQKNESFSFDLT